MDSYGIFLVETNLFTWAGEKKRKRMTQNSLRYSLLVKVEIARVGML
jgi:hypothetical protein